LGEGTPELDGLFSELNDKRGKQSPEIVLVDILSVEVVVGNQIQLGVSRALDFLDDGRTNGNLNSLSLERFGNICAPKYGLS